MFDDDALPKVTAAMLRQAGTMCGCKLSHDHANHGGNRLASRRYRVSNQLAAHARVAQLDLGPPLEVAFDPVGLEPEEEQIYRQAARTYVQQFAGDARAVDCDEWETTVPELGIRLVGNNGLPFERGDGGLELRFLSLGRNYADPDDPLASSEARFALLRHSDWAKAALVRLVHVDLLLGTRIEHTVAADDCLDELRPWLAERVSIIRDRAGEAVPRVNLSCGRCPYVPRCKAHG